MTTETEIIPFVRTETKSEHSWRMTYAVHGFWSDKVRVDQSKSWRTGEWDEPDVNWSCGGRDGNQEPSNIIAAECFAKAVADAVKVARKWQKESSK
jgi:hypothetical protein